MRTTRRTQSPAALLLVAALPLSACSLFAKAPDAREGATQFAQHLAKGDMSGIKLTGSTSADASAYLQKAYEGVGSTRPQITVARVETANEGQKATATLRSEWDFGIGKKWSYESELPMKLVDNTWQFTWDPAVLAPDLKHDEVLRAVRTQARRGDIVDRNGAPLLTEREVVQVGIDKSKSPSPDSARRIAELVGINPDTYAAKVAAAGDQAFVVALTMRKDDPDLSSKRSEIEGVSGAHLVEELRPLGPTRTWGQPLLGTVGPATAEVVQKSKGQINSGDVVGLSGLALTHDAQLRGTPGVSVRAVKVGADGSALDRRELFTSEGAAGAPLKLTLDTKMQTAAEEALASHKDMPVGMVVLDSSTGDVLVAASSPGSNGRNVALLNQAPPGSTFKIVSSLALARKGVGAEDKVPCTDTLVAAHRQFGNYSNFPRDHIGDIPLKSAMAVSCNTSFISFHQKISQDELISAASSLGMGDKLDLGFPAYMGSVPQTTDGAEHAATFIGQGKVEASPLTMATVIGSVVKGETVRPRLIQGANTPQPAAPKAPLTPEEVEQLRISLREVTTNGSGKKLQQSGVEMSKTGTAEFGTTNPPKTHAWMVASKGNLAIAVFVEEGPNGSTSAAPVINDFFSKLG